MAWFKDWFNTKYYHILYKNRDYSEANAFVSHLVEQLHIPADAYLLDLACGRGRHAIFLHGLGYRVDGVDLSPKSIKTAKKYESAKLTFAVHDMRDVYKANAFDYVFNLFTSFGYFTTDEENQRAINAMHANLKPGGRLVLDFMNTPKVVRTLIPHEVKVEEGIEFHIHRSVDEQFIRKKIEFSDAHEHYSFTESVRALSKEDFETFFTQAGLHIDSIYGDYQLRPYDKETSDRLIFFCSKPYDHVE